MKKTCLALFCLLIAATAQATTYYVSPTGSNSNSGLSASFPWKTISYAATQAASGSTVYVAPGTYGTAEGEIFPLNIDGKFISSSLHQAIINTKSSLMDGKISLETGAILDGFTIGGSMGATSFYLINVNGGAHEVIIKNNLINAAGHQVAVNKIAGAYDVTIEANVIYSSINSAIWLQSDGNATIKQNEIRNTVSATAVLVDGAASGTILIDRNTIVNNGMIGIQTSNPSGATIRIDNNIVANNGLFWLDLAVPVSSRKYNCVYANDPGGEVLDPTDLALDPKFNNAGTNDYSLKVNSPCINAGNPDNDNDLTTFYNDADDRDPDNTRLDIGAYYYNVGSGPFYVAAAEGDDVYGDGTVLHPFQSLTRVATFAALDSTVYVKPGTYGTESWPVNLSGLFVYSSPEGQATIALPNDTAGYIVTMSNRAGKLQGFILTGRTNGDPSSAGILLSDKPSIIRNNTLYARFISGIRLAAGASGSLIDGNIIYGNGSAGTNGIKIDQTVISNEIYKNVIRNFDNGLYLKGIVDAVPATTFHHNTLAKNNTGVYVEHAVATINSNIIACGVGGHATAGTVGIKAVNDALTSVSSTYNTLYANETVYDDSGSKISNKIGDATSDPLFVDATANDYHLQVASPAINTGDPSAQYNDPDGTRSDRGAYYRDVTPPAVTVLSPNGGETLIGGKNSDITWTATDLGDGFGSTPITFRYSTDEGTSWTQIATGQYNISPFTWLVPAISYTTCRVSIEAVDIAGNIGSDMSNANFTISGGLYPAEGGYVSSQTPTFSWNAIDGAVKYDVLVDGVVRGTGIASTLFPLNILYALSEGAHTWTLRAIGSRDETINETLVHFTVDLTAPTITMSSISTSAIAGTEITISGTVSDNYLIDKAEISFDNKVTWSEMNLTGTNIEYKKIFTTPGTYTINARVTDRAGNVTNAAPFSLTVVGGGTGGLVTELSYATGAANGLAILNMRTANLEAGTLTIMLFDSNPPNNELSRNTVSVDSTTSLASINLAAGGVSLSRKTVICKVFNNGKLIFSKNILVP